MSPDEQQTTPVPTEEQIPLGEVLLSWKSPEFQTHQRGQYWFIVVGIVAAFLVALTIFLGYYVAAIAFFLGAVVWLILAQQQPQVLPIAIHEYGVAFGTKRYPYQDVESFWLFYEPPGLKTLNFRLKKRISAPLTIELDDQDPNEVRRVLKEFIEEDVDREEEMPDKLARIMKF